MHVLQLGTDAALLEQAGDGEALERQQGYARELLRLTPGAHVSIIVISPIGRPVARHVGNISIFGVPGKGVGRLGRIARQMRKIRGARPVDLVTVQSVWDENAWVALAVARLWRVPCLAQIHTDCFSAEFDREVGRGIVARIRQATWPRLLQYFAAFRVVGNRIRSSLIQRGIAPARIAVVPVPMKIVSGGNALCVAETRPQVLFVGRLVEQKNLTSWLAVAQRVAAQVPACEFVLIGSGPLRENLERAAVDAGLRDRVRFLGYVDHDQLPGHYARASVFLLTSYHEGFGRVIAEALAFGVPCVATRVAGVEDIIEEGQTGYLHAIGDVEGLAASVSQLLRDKALRQQMAARGQTSVRERFSASALTARWVGVWIATASAREIDKI